MLVIISILYLFHKKSGILSKELFQKKPLKGLKKSTLSVILYISESISADFCEYSPQILRYLALIIKSTHKA